MGVMFYPDYVKAVHPAGLPRLSVLWRQLSNVAPKEALYPSYVLNKEITNS
jgi:hypothetical protein